MVHIMGEDVGVEYTEFLIVFIPFRHLHGFLQEQEVIRAGRTIYGFVCS